MAIPLAHKPREEKLLPEAGYSPSVPALDGCFTQGDSEQEALENAKEAILCYLQGLEKVNQIKAQPGVLAKEVEVTL